MLKRLWSRRIGLAAATVALTLVTSCSSHDAKWQTGSQLPEGGSSVSSKPATVAGGQRTITILGAGDELLHPQVWAQGLADAKAAGKTGYYFDPIFTSVKPAIEAADVAICHMETPLAPANGPYEGFPRFSVPPQIAQTVHDLGYDTCSTASNHTLDQGTAGIKRTLDALDAAGVKHAGSYRTEADSHIVNMLTVTPKQGGQAVKVAQLSYTFGFNGLTPPQPWVANQTDPTAILAAAHAARQKGANIVVLSIHWGVEYSHTPNADQQKLAAQLLASPDIDLILGCHEHVVQPIAKVGGKWVVYGMGNQVARHDQPINDNREGIMPEFTFVESTPGNWTVKDAAFIATWVDLSPAIRVIDLPEALADPATPASRKATYQAAEDRIKAYVESMGGGLTLTSGIG